MKELFSISSKKKSASPPTSKSVLSFKERSVETFEPPASSINIATRRRLSTPKASPVPDRVPSQKSSKISHISSYKSDVSTKPTPKTSWFKSLERLSRKNKVTNSSSTMSHEYSKQRCHNSQDSSDVKKPPSVRRSNTTLSRATYQRAQSPSPDFKPAKQQNLRFFGDTDMESLSKATTTNRKRAPLAAHNSQSMQNLRPSRNPTRSSQNADNTQHVREATSMQSLHRVSAHLNNV